MISGKFTVSAPAKDIAVFKAYAAACDRSLSNFAVHAMRSYMRRSKKNIQLTTKDKNASIYPFAGTRTKEYNDGHGG